MTTPRQISAAMTLAAVAGWVLLAGCGPRRGEAEAVDRLADTSQVVEDRVEQSAPPRAIETVTEPDQAADPTTELQSLEDRRREIEEREAEVRAREAEVDRREREEASRARSVAPPRPPVVEPAGESAVAPGVVRMDESFGDATSPVEPSSAGYEAPAPVRRPVGVTVPAGTSLDVEIEDSLSSATSRLGDRFRSRVVADVMIDGEPVIPAGSIVLGSVTEVVAQKKIGGQARIAVAFERLELPSGESVAIAASFAGAGRKQTRKDAATIGGSAAGGAILGRVIDRRDKDKGSVVGAIIGAAIGTAVAANNAGDDVEIPVGTILGLQLDREVRLTIER